MLPKRWLEIHFLLTRSLFGDGTHVGGFGAFSRVKQNGSVNGSVNKSWQVRAYAAAIYPVVGKAGFTKVQGYVS
jgi:hypothetical protein